MYMLSCLQEQLQQHQLNIIDLIFLFCFFKKMQQLKKVLIYGIAIFTFLLYGCTTSRIHSSDLQANSLNSSPQIIASSQIPSQNSDENLQKSEYPILNMPQQGFIYHGVYPGGITGEEDDLTLEDLLSYEKAAGKKAAWVYFSDNWYHGRDFPSNTASWIKDHGSIPYIRLMLRSDSDTNHAEPVFTIDNILAGDFDNDLRVWMKDAKKLNYPILVEYGPEMNGDWFSWNGKWNGKGITNNYGDQNYPNGPEKFRDAYRRIIDISREEGAYNIQWVFHVNSEDSPDVSWNMMENYYPGDDYIEIIGISAYGTQMPDEDSAESFSNQMDSIYSRIEKMAGSKPIIISEFASALNPYVSQDKWAKDAFASISSGRWPKLAGFSWWNEKWKNDDNSKHDSDLKIQSSITLQKIFNEYVANDPNILGEPLIRYKSVP
jgi:hypothetical protein